MPQPISSRPGDTHHQGCLICGAGLEYRASAEPVRCTFCGFETASPVRCRDGHFVCDACHASPAKDVIERTCAASTSTDPMALATGLMRHPSLKLHGPEHHFLVPATLLAALSNARGDAAAKPRLLAEARRRSDAVAGGFCGFQGACGAGVGVGIFASVATGATPMARESWGLANGATARALTVIGGLGGPRCCKRTTWLALLTGIRIARETLGVRLDGRGAACEWSGRNAECLGDRCPFHREVRRPEG
ncbi:MAG TPA: DUF5714 domain-containing protein [Anaeromyxobacteraceae bacterium]|nr:DUF5714 domain-containing protein [Anaeromyxobacteraceae bacterium]